MKRLVTFLVLGVALGLPSHAMAVDVAHIRCVLTPGSAGGSLQDLLNASFFSSGVTAPQSCPTTAAGQVFPCVQCLADLQSNGFTLQELGYAELPSNAGGDTLYVLEKGAKP
jgi:hypothetical protein